jgi:hypothetical protein
MGAPHVDNIVLGRQTKHKSCTMWHFEGRTKNLLKNWPRMAEDWPKITEKL